MSHARDEQHGNGVRGPLLALPFSAGRAKKTADFSSSTIPVGDQGRQRDPIIQVKVRFTFRHAYGEEVTEFLPEHERTTCSGRSDSQGR